MKNCDSLFFTKKANCPKKSYATYYKLYYYFKDREIFK